MTLIKLSVKSFILAFFLVVIPTLGLAQNCPISLQIHYPDGEKGCLSDLPISKLIDKKWGRSVEDVAKHAGYYVIAGSSTCSIASIGTANPNLVSLRHKAAENIAIGNCPSNCECTSIVENGRVLLPKKLAYLLGSDKAILASNSIDKQETIPEAEAVSVNKKPPIDQKNLADIEATRQKELEITRLQDLEKKRLADIQRKSELETQAQKIREIELSKQLEIEAQKLADAQKKRELEALSQKKKELELAKQLEIEAQKQAESQRKRELELQAQKQRELEISKQRELEAHKLAEAQKIKDLQSRQKAEAESRERDRQLAIAAEEEKKKTQETERQRLKAESDAKERDRQLTLAAQEDKKKIQEAELQRLKIEAEAKDRERQLILALEQEKKKSKEAELQRLKIESDAKDKERQLALAGEEERRKYLVVSEAAKKATQVAENDRLERQKDRELLLELSAELARLRAEAQSLKNVQQSQQKQSAPPLGKSETFPALPIFANRKALVIGNDGYKFVSKLLNAKQDATVIAENLTKVGYNVTLKLDQSEKEMKATLRSFKAQVDSGDEVAIFYAGHGVQLANTNYLIPIDVAGEGEEQIKDEAISLQRILDDMSDKKVKFTLAMIDACRDNPFKSSGRSIGGGARGLAPTTAATGQMVVFSAGTGQQALDKLGPNDKDKNGLFTRVFIKEMQKSGVTIDQLVRNVRNEVVTTAKSIGHDQVPAIYDQVVGEFYFRK
jgi:hypothetical protein